MILNEHDYFYGFMITKDNKIITEYNNEEETNIGCYVLKNNNIITQDFFGCFGIYLYDEDFTAFNSLCSAYNSLQKITINNDYYNKLIISREVPFTLTETLFNELKRYNGSFKIDLNNKKIIPVDYKINSVNYKESKYLEILDKWYFKWVNIFKNINGDIIQDLSGGIDTRILLSISINANILNKILIRSKKNTLSKESIEDYNISSQIIKHYNLSEVKKIFINKNIDNSFNNYIVGNSNFTASLKTQPIKKVYRINGNGGLLYHRSKTFKNLLNLRYCKVDDFLLQNYIKYYNLVKIPDYIKEQNLKELYIYRKLIVELRDGIKSADYFRTNTIMISPMMDPELNMLNPLNEKGESVLPFIILKRYCPELLNFKIEGIGEKNIVSVDGIKTILKSSPTKERKKDRRIFFIRNEKENLNKDGSHSTGTDFLLVNRMLKNDSRN